MQVVEVKIVAFRKFVAQKFAISEEDLDVLEEYLRTRAKENQPGKSMGVVFEITKKCTLNCLHCGPAAEFVKNPKVVRYELDLSEVTLILDKLKVYVDEEGIEELYLIYGGGEPTLYPHIEDVVHYSKKLFGSTW